MHRLGQPNTVLAAALFGAAQRDADALVAEMLCGNRTRRSAAKSTLAWMAPSARFQHGGSSSESEDEGGWDPVADAASGERESPRGITLTDLLRRLGLKQ